MDLCCIYWENPRAPVVLLKFTFSFELLCFFLGINSEEVSWAYLKKPEVLVFAKGLVRATPFATVCYFVPMMVVELPLWSFWKAPGGAVGALKLLYDMEYEKSDPVLPIKGPWSLCLRFFLPPLLWSFFFTMTYLWLFCLLLISNCSMVGCCCSNETIFLDELPWGFIFDFKTGGEP